jgi:hypothetical protein
MPMKRLCVSLTVAVVVVLVVLAMVTHETIRMPKVCTNTGMWMNCVCDRMLGVTVRRREFGPYSTPLSRFLGTDASEPHEWRRVPGYAKHLVSPTSKMSITAPDEHREWFRRFLVQVVLNPQNDMQCAFGTGIANTLHAGIQIDWHLWMARAEMIGIPVSTVDAPANADGTVP